MADEVEKWSSLYIPLPKELKDAVWLEFVEKSNLMGVPIPKDKKWREWSKAERNNVVEFFARLIHVLSECPEDFFK